MTRLVILWNRPYGLSADEGRDWARDQVGRILCADTVRHAELTAVRGVSDRHTTECDWMLELHLGEGRSPHDFVDDAGAAAWLGDLQQLGLQPRVIAVDGGLVLRPDRS